MKRFPFFFLAIFAFFAPAAGQTTLLGTVVNAETGSPVPAVSVENTRNHSGTYTDRNGHFVLRAATLPVPVTLSHIGYATQHILLDSSGLTLSLTPIVLNAEEVLVTGNRAIKGKTPIAFTTLEKEDIDLLYHQQDVPLVLEMEPGVYAYSDAGNGSGYSYLNIRGFTQDRIGVMYNGIPLNDPEAHAVYWVDHGDVLNGASTVQVQRGIGNSLASGSFGGSVNIESDISQLEPGIRLTLGTGNYIDGNALNAPGNKRSLSYAGKLLPEQGVSLVLRFSELDSDGYRIGSGTEQQSFHAGLQWVQPTHMTRAEYLRGHEATRFSWDGVSPQYGYDLNDPDARRYNYYADTSLQGGYSDINRDVFTQSLALLSHTRLLTERIKLFATVYQVDGIGYYQQFKGGSDISEYNLASMLSDTTTADLICRKWLDNRYTGGVYHASYSSPGSVLTAGGDLRFYNSSHYGEVVYVEDHGYPDANHRFYENTTRKSTVSFYVQDIVTVRDRLYIQGDLRFLSHRYEVRQNAVGAFTDPVHFIVPYRFLDVHVGLRYHVTPAISSFIHLSTSKREPSSNDLYDDSDASVIPAVADPYGGNVTDPLIRHESLTDLEWGLDYRKGGASVQLNAYRMDFRNELIPVYYRYRDTDDVLRGNAPRTLHQGLELSAAVPVRAFDVRANLSLSDNHFVEFTADSLGWGGFGGIADYAGKTIPAFPALQVKLRLAYKHEGFQPWLTFRHIGKQYIDFMNTEASAIRPYSVADLGIRVPFNALGMRHILDVRINNLFNTLYETFGYSYYNSPDERIDSYWPAATRSFYLSWSLLLGL